MATRWAARAVLAAVAAIAALAGGCGGSGAEHEAPAAATPPPVAVSGISRSRFLKRANRICANTEGRALSGIKAYERDHGGELGDSEAERIAALNQAVLVRTMRKTIEAIRRLGAPPGERRQTEAVLAALRAATAHAAASELKSFYDFGDAFRHSDRVAVAFGLKGCTFSS